MRQPDGEDHRDLQRSSEKLGTETGEGRLRGEGINPEAGRPDSDTGGQVGATVRESAPTGEQVGTIIREPEPTVEEVGTTAREVDQTGEESGTTIRSSLPNSQ